MSAGSKQSAAAEGESKKPPLGALSHAFLRHIAQLYLRTAMLCMSAAGPPAPSLLLQGQTNGTAVARFA